MSEELTEDEVAGIVRYWEQPTGYLRVMEVEPGMVIFAKSSVDRLAETIAALRAKVVELEGELSELERLNETMARNVVDNFAARKTAVERALALEGVVSAAREALEQIAQSDTDQAFYLRTIAACALTIITDALAALPRDKEGEAEKCGDAPGCDITCDLPTGHDNDHRDIHGRRWTPAAPNGQGEGSDG